MKSSVKVLVVTPPMLQPNAPYPAGPFLTAYLRRQGVDAAQEDFSLALALALFSRNGVLRIVSALRSGAGRKSGRSPSVRSFLRHAAAYARTVGPVVSFLQGRAPAVASRIVGRRWLPEGPRFQVLQSLQEALASGDERTNVLDALPGNLPMERRAEYLASLFMDDIADAIREGVDPRFEFSRYGEKLSSSSPEMTPLLSALNEKPSLVNRMLDRITMAALDRHQPDLLALTVPFPGNVYAAFHIARTARARNPRLRIVLGGGYANTELRNLDDPRLFDFFDFVTLDDGEQPLLRVVQYLGGVRTMAGLLRTFVRDRNSVRYIPGRRCSPLRHGSRPAPCYDGLPLDRYIRLREMPNPMYTLWSDTFWNKLLLAHGCYWRRCAFCDTALDYIRRYDPAPAATVVRWIRSAIEQTGRRQFHFVDEAAPPALLREVAELLVRNRIEITWWANIRFEKNFTPELARLLARSGCIAVTGGIETACDRTLRVMNKGVDLRQAAVVCRALSGEGILVHAYLMYGFPTQSVQETVDGLEYVRQMFAAGAIHSAFWHRFSLTVHSAIFTRASAFGIHPLQDCLAQHHRGAQSEEVAAIPPRRRFAQNEAGYAEPDAADHARLGPGLKKAVYNFMHGVGVHEDVRAWFDVPVPRPRLGRAFVARAIRENQ